MRKILFLFTCLYTVCCYPQLYDDFSDGDFTHDPTWEGDVRKFKVDAKLQLRLDDKEKTGEARLSTPSTLFRGTEWSFHVHLQFNPSANNYALFYLTASEADLSGEGYALAIGGKDDNLRLLHYQDGATESLIEGLQGRLNLSSPKLDVRVSLDEEGRWSLYSRLSDEDADWVEEGTTTDDRQTTVASYIGIRCVYTQSRSTSFAFDDIRVALIGNDDSPEVPDEPEQPDPEDKEPPELLSVAAVSDVAVSVRFNEPVDIRMANIRIEGIGAAVEKQLDTDGQELRLTFAEKFEDLHTYTLFLENVKDKAGNRMTDTQVTFTYYDPELQALDFGDVVFNEIMANPSGAAALPEVEYVELYNRTDRPVNLNGWKFHYGEKAYGLTEGTIPSEGHAVLCHAGKTGQWEATDVHPVGIKSFPTLANSGKLLWMEDARGNLIAWVEYSDNWYDDGFKKKGGFSLECIDADNQANDPANWKASEDPSGGTPGKANSVRGVCPDETLAEIAYAYLPASDTLCVRFTKPMLPSSLSSTDNYTVYSGHVSIKAALPSIPDCREVRLALSDALRAGEVLEVELQHVEDISGFALEGDRTVRTSIPEDAETGDVRFNEILFNPRSGGSDYVEVYNCSSKYIGLHRLYFSSRNEEGGMGEGLPISDIPITLAPESYLCFTKDIPSLLELYECEKKCLFSVSRLPSLPDDKGNILLADASGTVIDEMNYEASMHTPFLKDKEGVSLEKLRPEMPSGSRENWVSASTASGGGTPGYVNSQYRELAGMDADGFQLEKQTFSPNGDGIDDELIISYRMADTEVQADVRVYSASGRLVCVLADRCRLQPEGVFTWDGRESDGTLARMGLYLIYIEAYTPSGKHKQYKLGCALGG